MKRRLERIETRQDDGPAAHGTPPLSRRAFMLRSTAALAVTSAPTGWLLALESLSDSAARNSLFSEKQIKNLSAVQAHLFPAAGGAPGADDINALPYLQFAMGQPDFEAGTREFIFRGLQYLLEAGMERYDLDFYRLDFAQKESLLRYLADRTRWGRNWLSLLLTYILEALLCDSAYGGNPGGIGWKWLQHQPGFPRPPAHKTYSRLRLQAARGRLPAPSRTRNGF